MNMENIKEHLEETLKCFIGDLTEEELNEVMINLKRDGYEVEVYNQDPDYIIFLNEEEVRFERIRDLQVGRYNEYEKIVYNQLKHLMHEDEDFEELKTMDPDEFNNLMDEVLGYDLFTELDERITLAVRDQLGHQKGGR